MTLGSGNIDLEVELPKGEDLNEWLAVNTIELNFIMLLTYYMACQLNFAQKKVPSNVSRFQI